jgi:hypothetical protein
LRAKIALSLLSILAAGCAALDTHQAKLDQKQLRDVLMDYEEDQILDNLIRASNGLPIVHFDIRSVTATVSSKITPSVGSGKTITGIRTRTPTTSTVTTDQTALAATGNTIMHTVAGTVSLVGGVVETVVKPFSYGASAERNNSVYVEMKPVVDERKLYAAYVKFLNVGSVREKPQSNTLETNKVTTTETDPTSEITTTEKSSGESTPGTASKTTETKIVEKTTSTTTEEVLKKEGEDLIVTRHTTPPPPNTMQPLMRRSAPPSANRVLVGPKYWKGQYYWVPIEYQKDFFELCLATVTRGGAPGSTAGAPAQNKTDALKNELEDFNSLERQNLTTPR